MNIFEVTIRKRSNKSVESKVTVQVPQHVIDMETGLGETWHYICGNVIKDFPDCEIIDVEQLAW